MLVGIDHVILACADPDAAAAEIEALVGLAATGGGRHESFGTFNRLVWLGDSFIELVGVFDEQVALSSWFGAHMVEALRRGEPAYGGIALASESLTADLARLHELGAPISAPSAGERVRADGQLVRWSSARLPAPDPDLGLCFLIEHDASAAEWRPADRVARAQQLHPLGSAARLVRLEVPVRDVHQVTSRLLRNLALQFRPSIAGRGARDTSVGTQTLRISHAQRPVITVRAGTIARRVSALGYDWELVPA